MDYEYDFSFDNQLMVKDQQGMPVVRVAFVAALFFRDAYMDKKREAIAQCIEDYLNRVSAHINFATNPKTHIWKDIRKKKTITPREWFKEIDEYPPFEFHFRGGKVPQEADLFKLSCFGGKKLSMFGSYLTFSLPMSWFTVHEGDFTTLVHDYCIRLAPTYAYGGLGVRSRN